MSVQFLLSVSLLSCLASAGPVTFPGPNEARFIIQVHQTGDSVRTEYDGVFIYKNGEVKKLLGEGTSMFVFYEPHAIAYIGSTKGIYRYDDSTEKLEKYGNIDDSIIDIRKSNNTDTIYILTEDHKVYKVTEGGIKKTKIDEADGALKIEMDWDETLYFIGADKQPYVVTKDGVKKIQGLPSYDGDNANLYRASPDIEHGINLVWDKSIYYIFADGTSRVHELSDEENSAIEDTLRVSQEIIKKLDGKDA